MEQVWQAAEEWWHTQVCAEVAWRQVVVEVLPVKVIEF